MTRQGCCRGVCECAECSCTREVVQGRQNMGASVQKNVHGYGASSLAPPPAPAAVSQASQLSGIAGLSVPLWACSVVVTQVLL